jgi:type IV pilus assembly protein PilC
MQAGESDSLLAFDWSARDAQGRLQRGRSQAGGHNQVRALLRRRGLHVIDVQTVRVQRLRRPSTAELVRFTRQLAALLRAGLPLLESLQMIARTHNRGAAWTLAGEIHGDLQNGLSLSAALRRQGAVFSDLYIALVEAGEVSGQLDLMLERIVIHLEKTEAMVRRVRSALTYPAVVLSVAVAVLAVIMVAVVPAFETVFASFGAELPWATQVVVGLSRWSVQAVPWLIGAALAATLILAWAWKNKPGLADWVDDTSLALPLWGALLQGAAVARWSRTLSTLLAAGLPLAQALQSVGAACGHRAHAQATERVRREILRGSSLHAALALEPVFPALLQQMCAVGEESGSLDHLLEKAADFQEGELDERMQRLSTLIEPVTVLFLGLVVGALVLSLYLPVFQMGQIL